VSFPSSTATSRFTAAQRLYFYGVIAAGLAITGVAARELYRTPPSSQWLVLAALTLLTGSFTIRVTKLSIRISVSDAFVFASVLLFGTAVATVIVAIDSLVATLFMRRENRSIFRSLFNVAVASGSIWVAATTFYALTGPLPGPGVFVLTKYVGPLLLLAGLYFLVNSWLIAIALGFEQRAPIPALWWQHFPWFSLNYFGGVSAAALLVSYTRSVDIGAVSVILPLLVISYLTYRTSLDRVQDAQNHVEQLNELYMSTIETLAMAVDAKDQITHGHIRRVQVFAVELAKRLGVTNEHQLHAIQAAALLHDMGKLAIPEHILNKPGKLTSTEFDKMKQHAAIGADLLSSIKFPYPVVPIVRHHHEQWDGKGYPTGIAGTDIPLGARILSVVDCFDALTSDRPYRPRLSDEDAFKILRERSGTMYDPLVVDRFARTHAEIAPEAIRAGQEARTLYGALGAENHHDTSVLSRIRANATENTLLLECIRRLPSVPRKDVLTVAADYLRQQSPARVFAFFRYDALSDVLRCDQAIGDPVGLLGGLTIRPAERITGWCAVNNRSSVNSNAALDLLNIAEMFDPPLRSTLATPLFDGDVLVGVLSAYATQEDGFNEEHRYIVEQIALTLGECLSRVEQPARAAVLRHRG
jgi:putative nucleotidyltransferase with HDIG domain